MLLPILYTAVFDFYPFSARLPYWRLISPVLVKSLWRMRVKLDETPFINMD